MSILSSRQEALEEQGYFFYESVGDVKRYHVNLISWQADASSLSEIVAYAEKHKEVGQELKQTQERIERLEQALQKIENHCQSAYQASLKDRLDITSASFTLGMISGTARKALGIESEE